MSELQFSYVRIAVLVEVAFFVCCFFYSPVNNVKQQIIKKEYALYADRKKLLEQSVYDLRQTIKGWEVSSFKKESFAREQLNMARLDEIVYYLSVAK